MLRFGYREKKTLKPQMAWEEFKTDLMLKFGTAPYKDGFGELCKLRQTTTMRDYQSRFECFFSKVGLLKDQQETTCFINGLKEPLRSDVRAQNPNNLSSTIALARIYKGKSQEARRGPNDYMSSPFVRKSPVANTRIPENEDRGVTKELPVRRFTPTELQKRREQGLYCHCDERYTFNHACKKFFWIELEEEIQVGLEEVVAEGDEKEAKPEVFLNSMVGLATPQTMRVMDKIGKITLMMLIDTGSTHNFLHEPLAKLMGLKTESNSSL